MKFNDIIVFKKNVIISLTPLILILIFLIYHLINLITIDINLNNEIQNILQNKNIDIKNIILVQNKIEEININLNKEINNINNKNLLININYLKKINSYKKLLKIEKKYLNYIIRDNRIIKKEDIDLLSSINIILKNIIIIKKDYKYILNNKNLSKKRKDLLKNIIKKEDNKYFLNEYNEECNTKIKEIDIKINILLKKLNKNDNLLNDKFYLVILIILNLILIILMIFYLSKNKNRMNQILNGLNIENDIINISDIDEPNEFIKNIEKYNKNKNKIKLQDLEEISSTKDLFLSGISHEVRTPLNAIIGFSNILQSNERLTNEELEYIDIINNNAKDLLSFLSEHIDIINKINIKEKENLINKINTRIKILLFEKTSNDIENSFNNIIKSKDMFDLTKSNDSNIILNNIKEYYFDIIIIDLDDLEKNDNNLLKNIEIFEKENMNKLLKIGITYHNKYKVKNSICDYYLTNCYTKPLKDDDILYILNLTLFN